MKFYRLLTVEEAAGIVRQIKDVDWAQGRASSDYATEHVKKNHELVESHSEAVKAVITELKQKFVKNQLWEENYVVSMMAPRFNRYGDGDEYKTHADAAWMGRVIRTDLACTLFLTDDYEGGELCIDDTAIKCEPGVAVVYSCWRPHHVKAVTKGERISAVTWMQSLFRDETEREVMQMFGRVLGGIRREEAEGRHYSSLSAVYSKLMRMWMET